jgi:DNA helicase-2/ATP-dependent DNA helicase PcrA
MTMSLLADLNAIQKEAVTFDGKNLLVLAGAGSGKTRVLVHRIAWLLSNGMDVSNILAVTFTNKAANEMRSRLEAMLQRSLGAMWVGTFHGLAHRLLRKHWQEAKLEESFQILDTEDQARILKGIHKALSLDVERWPVKQSQQYINTKKERGIRSNVINASNFLEETLVKIYRAYEDICQRGNLVDFAELLLRSYELLGNYSTLREFYRDRFRHILVDEFQDTNNMQYLWVKEFYGDASSLTVVGDDDQSIYSWRGADSGNMKRLNLTYRDLHTVRLEQNYRSTANILEAANAVIANNGSRLGKKLWTEATQGEPLVVYAAFNEIDEARYIADKVVAMVQRGIILNDMAILYRSNAQSRIIEEKLLENGLSYRIYGGIRFFERAEIRDVLAYLRLALNPHDDVSFERVVNLPARGVGEVALTALRDQARLHGYSLWQTAKIVADTKQLSSRVVNALDCFLVLVNEIAKQAAQLDLATLISFVIGFIGLREHYAKPQYAEYKQSRLENLDELVTAAKQAMASMPTADHRTNLQTFLANVSLEAGERSEGQSESSINLMTLHAAKGLEFKVVFLCGMEDGLFPHVMSMKDRGDLEEERRLCYVGMTRAMQQLYLSYAESRQIRGISSFCKPSRFLREIPRELLRSEAMTNKFQSSAASKGVPSKNISIADGNSGFLLGQMVFHRDFGEGIIIDFEGQGEYLLIRIKFKNYGIKLLSPKYAQLKIVT